MYPAIDLVERVLPGMRERGAGGLLFAGGLSAVTPMPFIGTLTIGGLVERGDIHQHVASRPDQVFSAL